MEAGTITITGHGGDEIEAYLARPTGGAPYGGMVVIHHLPGYDAGDQGDRAPVRGQRVRGAVPEPVLPPGARREPRRRGGLRPRAGRDPRRAARRRRRRRRAAPAGAARRHRQGRGDRVLLRRAPDVPRGLLAASSTPPSTATARSSSTSRPRGSRSPSSRCSGSPRSCRARCWACSAPTTRPRRPRRPRSSRPSWTGWASRTSSTPTRARGTRSSPSTGPPTAPRRPSTAGRRSSRSSAPTWRFETMCTYVTEKVAIEGSGKGADGLVRADPRHGLRRPPGPRARTGTP